MVPSAISKENDGVPPGALPDVDLLTIVKMLPDVIFRCEKRADGKVYFTLNEGRLAEEFHLTTKEVRNRPLDELFPPDVVARILPEFERGFRGETREFLNELGGRVFRHYPQAVFDGSGKVVALVGFISEVTNLKRAEEALAAANQELEAFSFSVSHDLRTPLTVLDTTLQLLRAREASHLTPKAKEDVARMEGAARRMSQLINDLLRFSRASRAELHRETVDVSDMAATIAAELRSREPSRKATINVQRGLSCKGDPGLVRVVLENLLGNAWKYSRNASETRIEVGLRQRSGRSWFYVTDNGAGFDPSLSGKLFRAFERLHGSEFEGTGVGLATVKRILQRHGGEVAADSRPGAGATFYFHLGATPVEALAEIRR